MAANPTSLTPPDKYNKFRGRTALNKTLSCSLTTARVVMGPGHPAWPFERSSHTACTRRRRKAGTRSQPTPGTPGPPARQLHEPLLASGGATRRQTQPAPGARPWARAGDPCVLRITSPLPPHWPAGVGTRVHCRGRRCSPVVAVKPQRNVSGQRSPLPPIPSAIFGEESQAFLLPAGQGERSPAVAF